MKLEDDIFRAYALIPEALLSYGFRREEGAYVFEKAFRDGAFKAIVEVRDDGTVNGKVIEEEFGEEFAQLHVEAAQGAFVGEIREAYEEILLDIRKVCFIPQPFVSVQANRLGGKIVQKYGEDVDYPFGTSEFEHYGVFRYAGNQKWYALIMNVPRNRVDLNVRRGLVDKSGAEERVDIMNLKVDEAKRDEILKIPGIYPSYHMSKTKWISVILDGKLDDELVLSLVDTSRTLVSRKKTSGKSGKKHEN